MTLPLILILVLVLAFISLVVYVATSLSELSKRQDILARRFTRLNDSQNVLFEAIKHLQEAVYEPEDEEQETSQCTDCPDLPDKYKGLVPHTGHAIIVGGTGSGKSKLTMSLLMERIIAGHQVYLVDTKRELGPLFEPYCDRVVQKEGATELLNTLIKVSEQRQKMFEDYVKDNKKVVANVFDYNRLNPQSPLPIITVMLEELIVLSELGPEFVKAFTWLSAISRSAGIYILTCSQYLNATILPKACSVNFGVRIYLGRFDKTTCNVILFSQPLNKQEIELLGPPGLGVVEVNGVRAVMQFPMVTDEMLEEWIQ